MRIFLLFLLISSYLFAFPEQEFINSEEIMSIQDQLNDSTRSVQDITTGVRENDKDEDNTLFIKEKVLFLSYLTTKQKLYVNEVFKIDLKAIVAVENPKSINTAFLNYENIKILNPNSTWKQSGENNYENSYYIKVLSKDALMADFKVSVTSNDGYEDSEILPAFLPKIIALKGDNKFSFVLASEFNLVSHNEKMYDENTNIVVLEINASMANLEDFKLSYATRNGIDAIQTNLPDTNIYYFAIIPNSMNEFKFKYFDLNTNRFKLISFPIVLKDSSVSTQTSLNPKKSKFLFYKSIALVILAFIFVLVYLKYKKIYFVGISLILLVYMGYLHTPISKISLHEGMTLSILPTKNSTIFYKVDKPTEADILYEKDNYIKVILPNKKIGWLNKDDFKKD